MDRKGPTTENWEELLGSAKWDTRRSLPGKLALLRQKLHQKAKQEPTFRFYAAAAALETRSRTVMPLTKTFADAVCGKSARTV